jgi:hypothetical protein
VITDYYTLDQSLLPYLYKYSQYVDSLDLWTRAVTAYLYQLPPALQLTSLILQSAELQLYSTLEFHNPGVELHPDYSWQGVLTTPGLRGLKQLRLRDCTLLDGTKGLAAALKQLPGLQHLSLDSLRTRGRDWQFEVYFPTDVLEQLQHLTFLELRGDCLLHPQLNGGSNSLQPLQALTRLADLRIKSGDGEGITAEILSSLCNLTRLELPCETVPAMLAGKSRLQHVYIRYYSTEGSAAGAAALLSQLQQLKQLTHLDLHGRLAGFQGGNPPAAAFSAITASSKLQCLDMTACTLPAGVWQHMFPDGRQLPHLKILVLSEVQQPSGEPAAAPDSSRLISCCPGLQTLGMYGLEYSVEQLAPLRQLRGLRIITTLWDNIWDPPY